MDAITPGELVDVLPGVRRLTAPNAGPMTGPGTNAWLAEAGGCVLIDPGPDIGEHLDALLAAVGDQPFRVALTHTHPDHAPAAQVLRERTGCEIWAGPDVAGDRQIRVEPDRVLTEGDDVGFAPGSLKALHTPGHASNHFCFLTTDGVLFSGDHIMSGSTVVINPPDGDMAAYLDSLARLLDEPLTAIAAGHGPLITEPKREVEKLIRHRRLRERKVLSALKMGEAQTMGQLVVKVYDDVPEALHPVARRSLLAHLIHLRGQGLARGAAGSWSAMPGLGGGGSS